MTFVKLRYRDSATGTVLPNMQQRVEFFFQYWTFLFTSRHAVHDIYYLKSHRTIVNKVRLQIEGNFKYARSRIKQFLTDDEYFAKTDLVTKKIGGTSTRKAIYAINKFVKTSGNWNAVTPRRVITQLDKLQQWLDTSYSSHLADCCTEILFTDLPLNDKEIKHLMKLVNCFIIELFHKGYNKKYISDVPYNMFDRDSFPYPRARSSFANETAYENYKTSVWQSLRLEDQIESLRGLLDRPNRNRYLIYKITNINFRAAPVNILGVEFYSPHFIS